MIGRVQKALSHVVSAIVLALFFASLGLAEITETRVGIEGTMCPHCADVLQKALVRLQGVDKVEVTLEPQQATITLKPGSPLEVEKLRKAFVETEFTPTWIRFEAVGMLTLREGTPGLKVQGTEQVIPLESDGKLAALMEAVRRDCELLFIVGLIPPGKATARIERFEVRGLLGHPC